MSVLSNNVAQVPTNYSNSINNKFPFDRVDGKLPDPPNTSSKIESASRQLLQHVQTLSDIGNAMRNETKRKVIYI